MMPTFIMTGSRITAAISSPCSRNSSSSAPASLNGTMIVSFHIDLGTPLDVGWVVYAVPEESADSPETFSLRPRASASGTTENSTASWWPW